jgi:hypothetical protein
MLTAYGAARAARRSRRQPNTGNMGTQVEVSSQAATHWHPYLNEFSSVMTIHTDIQYYAICKAFSCLAFSSTAETFCLQGKLVTTQRKCKATSDLANGTILQYPSPISLIG